MDTSHELDSGLTEEPTKAPENNYSQVRKETRKETRKRKCALKPYVIVTLSFTLLCVLLTSVRLDSITPWTEGRKHLTNELHYWTQQSWIFSEQSLYLFVSTKMNWTDCREYCLQRNSDLIVINSKAEQGLVKRLKGPSWIGLGEQDTEGNLKWVDGTEMTSSWRRSRLHNDSAVGYCTEVANNSKWVEEPCDKLNHGICEKVVVLEHLAADRGR